MAAGWREAVGSNAILSSFPEYDLLNCNVTLAKLTLSLPGVLNIKIQDESQISFCKILEYK